MAPKAKRGRGPTGNLGKKVKKKPTSAAPRLPDKTPNNALAVQAIAMPRRRTDVRIGSDCSGWCTEVLAAMAITAAPLTHVFACDSNRSVRKLLGHFLTPLHMFTDVANRYVDKVPGDLDLYVSNSAFPRAFRSVQITALNTN